MGDWTTQITLKYLEKLDFSSMPFFEHALALIGTCDGDSNGSASFGHTTRPSYPTTDLWRVRSRGAAHEARSNDRAY